MRRRIRHSAAMIVALFVVALASASSAMASHGYVVTFHSGYLDPDQGDGTGYYYCHRLWQSRASWGYGPYMTVALIDTSGGWVRSGRDYDGAVEAAVSPSSGYSLKAHCKNSDATSTFLVTCRADVAEPHGVCV